MEKRKGYKKMPKKRNKPQNTNNKVNVFFDKINGKKLTILQQFEMFLEEKPTVDDVIGFLSVQNALLIGETSFGELTEERILEIYEFFVYFMENFDELTVEARMRNWPDDAYILRLGEEIFKQKEKEFLDNLTDKQRHEVQTLADTIMNIRKDRILIFSILDETWKEHAWNFFIPKTLKKNELKECKQELFILCANVICNYGSIVIRTMDKDVNEIFGIRVIHPIQVWSPISKEEMLDAHTLAPNGVRLAPEEGLVYTEIMREKI